MPCQEWGREERSGQSSGSRRPGRPGRRYYAGGGIGRLCFCFHGREWQGLPWVYEV